VYVGYYICIFVLYLFAVTDAAVEARRHDNDRTDTVQPAVSAGPHCQCLAGQPTL